MKEISWLPVQLVLLTTRAALFSLCRILPSLSSIVNAVMDSTTLLLHADKLVDGENNQLNKRDIRLNEHKQICDWDLCLRIPAINLTR